MLSADILGLQAKARTIFDILNEPDARGLGWDRLKVHCSPFARQLNVIGCSLWEHLCRVHADICKFWKNTRSQLNGIRERFNTRFCPTLRRTYT